MAGRAVHPAIPQPGPRAERTAASAATAAATVDRTAQALLKQINHNIFAKLGDGTRYKVNHNGNGDFA